jgi:hypothetical protein
MNDVGIIAPVRKTVRVEAPIAHAFEVFTSGLSRWWPFDHGVGKQPIQKVLMEPRLGGRWLEIADDGTETSVATITHWEPNSCTTSSRPWARKQALRCARTSMAAGRA